VARSFGTEFRHADGDAPVEVDYAANAESLGCAAYRARTEEELERALDAAREGSRPALIECRVEPVPAPPSGAWWELGVPEVSGDEEVAAAARAQRAGAAGQRWFG